MAVYTVNDDRILDMWKMDYRTAIANGNSPDYGEPDHMVVIADGHYCDTAILMGFTPFTGGEIRYLSVYFNQSGETDSRTADGDMVYESAEASNDPREWLDNMYGATDWGDWQWEDTTPGHC